MTEMPKEPAWLPDPQGSGRLRLWDGSNWTDHYGESPSPGGGERETGQEGGSEHQPPHQEQPSDESPAVVKDNLDLPAALDATEVKQLLAQTARGSLFRSPSAFDSYTQIESSPFIWVTMMRVNETRSESTEVTSGSKPPSSLQLYGDLSEITMPKGREWESGEYLAVKNGSWTTDSCGNCSGAGEHTCDECGGRHWLPCSCDRGYNTCFICNGSGWTNYGGKRETCICNGGKDICGICHGRGEYECSRCNANGIASCRRCRSTGNLTRYTQGKLEVTKLSSEVALDPLNLGREKATLSGALPTVDLNPSKAPWGLPQPFAEEVDAMVKRRDEGETRRWCRATVVPATVASSEDTFEDRKAWIIGTKKEVLAKGGYSRARVLSAVAAVLVLAGGVGLGAYFASKPTKTELAKADAMQKARAENAAMLRRQENALRKSMVGKWRGKDLRLRFRLVDGQLLGTGKWTNLEDPSWFYADAADCTSEFTENYIEVEDGRNGVISMDDNVTNDPDDVCIDSVDDFVIRNGKLKRIEFEDARLRLKRD